MSVSTRKVIIDFFWPSCAARTASTIVKLLQISTPVLIEPMARFMNWLVLANASGYMLR